MLNVNDIEVSTWSSGRASLKTPGVKVVHKPTGLVETEDSATTVHCNTHIALYRLLLKLKTRSY